VESWEEPRVTPAGLMLQARPVLGETENVSVTVPVNPFTGATVTVEAPVVAAVTVTLVELAPTEKSGTGTL
jgi:hypothetical protein